MMKELNKVLDVIKSNFLIMSGGFIKDGVVLISGDLHHNASRIFDMWWSNKRLDNFNRVSYRSKMSINHVLLEGVFSQQFDVSGRHILKVVIGVFLKLDFLKMSDCQNQQSSLGEFVMITGDHAALVLDKKLHSILVMADKDC